jgi:hypothetical protein
VRHGATGGRAGPPVSAVRGVGEKGRQGELTAREADSRERFWRCGGRRFRGVIVPRDETGAKSARCAGLQQGESSSPWNWAQDRASHWRSKLMAQAETLSRRAASPVL